MKVVESPRGLGRIVQWPHGFAMTIGVEQYGRGWAVRCCEGHATPEEAKDHGILRLIEIVTAVSAADVADWRNEMARTA